MCKLTLIVLHVFKLTSLLVVHDNFDQCNKVIRTSQKDNLSYEKPVSQEILSEVDGIHGKAHYPEEKHDDNLKKVIKEICAELTNHTFTVEIPLN